jgi:hypothetical protein
LLSLGLESIRAIPDDFSLSELQVRVREVLRSGRPHFGPGLADALAEVQLPLSYLDFETVGPAIPIWPGTYPFQRIPFQWSLHRTAESGTLTHAEFLADGYVDPRRSVAESLVEHLGSSNERIVVYSIGFESGVLSDLAGFYADLAQQLLGIKDRLWDLLPVVRNHVYLPDFGGSFSIKSVAPALIPEVRYTELDGVSEGMAASDAFMRLLTGEFGAGQTEHEVRKSLLNYCSLDTLAMVRTYDALRRVA